MYKFSTATILVICLAILILGCSDNKVMTTDSIMYRGNPNRTGVYSNQSVDQPRELKWKFNAGAPISSTPVDANGIVYFGEGRNLEALNANDGQEKWKFKTRDKVSSSPAVVNGIVYFGSWDGFLYAIDANTGKEVWKFETERASQPPADTNTPDHGILSSPTIYNGIVYFGSYGDFLYALNGSTGEKIWDFKANGPIDTSPAVSDGVLIFSSDTKLYTLDAGTGKEKWEAQTGSETMVSTPTIVNGVVIVNDGYNIHAIEIDNGKEKWNKKVGQESLFDCAVSIINGLVLYSDLEGTYAIEVQTGETKWEYKTPKSFGATSPPSVAGSEVYYADLRGYIVALAADEGSLKWQFKYSDNGFVQEPTPLAITDGVIYLGSMDGNVYALEGGSSS